MGIQRLYRKVKGTSANGERSFDICRVVGTAEELEEALEYLMEEFPSAVFTPGQPMNVHGTFSPTEDLNCIDIMLIPGGRDGFNVCGSRAGGMDRRASEDGDSECDRGYAASDRKKEERRRSKSTSRASKNPRRGKIQSGD